MPRVTRGVTRKEEEEKESRLRFVPPLPQEVLHIILKNLHQETDRNTLSQCMRVSTSFNEITAPLLYRSISIGDKEAKGDVLYSAPKEKGQLPRKSVNKKTCLTYVRELEVVNHSDDNCPQIQFAKYKSLNTVDVLRLYFPTPKKQETFQAHICTDHLVYGGSACPAICNIRAGKIVISNTGIAEPIPPFMDPQRTIHTIVSAFTHDDELPLLLNPYNDSSILFKGSTAKSKRAVYILWLPHPKAVMRIAYATVSQAQRAVDIGDICSDFVDEVVLQAMEVDFPNDIVSVNIEGLEAGIKEEDGRQQAMRAAQDGYWRTVIQSRIVDLSNKSARCKSPEEARKITFKFISMQTYLEEYDWRGEFRADEVEKWLNPKNKRRG